MVAILIVTSYVGHDDVRSAHRNAISKTELAEANILRVFLLANIPDKEKFIKQAAIENEHHHFNDIVQGKCMPPKFLNCINFKLPTSPFLRTY